MPSILQPETVAKVVDKLSEFGLVTVILAVIFAYVLIRAFPHLKECYVKSTEIKERYRTHRAKIEAKVLKRLEQSADQKDKSPTPTRRDKQ